MKCDYLKQSDLNLVKITQPKKQCVVYNGKGFENYSPHGNNIIDKKIKAYCTCEAATLKKPCPKFDTKKKLSAYRVTPVCFNTFKLFRKSQIAKE